jgi:hypothetical protein
MSELIRLCLVLKIILTLCRFPICLNFFETPFTCGACTEATGFYPLLGRLLPLELLTESMNLWG